MISGAGSATERASVCCLCVQQSHDNVERVRMMTQEQACVGIPRGQFPGFWCEMKVVTAQAFHQQQYLAAIVLQVLVVMLCAWAPSIAQVFIRHRVYTAIFTRCVVRTYYKRVRTKQQYRASFSPIDRLVFRVS